jgi:molybdate transport system substrate-binding protein
VRAIYGASDELADHLLAGAPGDVFISADPTEIKRLRRAGRLDREKARVVAANQLALVASDNHKRHHKNMSAAWNAMDKIAIAAPTCPLGRYSTRFLKLTGQYQRSLPKLLLVDNSRGVVSAIRSGAAEAGIAFMSDAKSAGNCITLGRVPYNKVAAKYLGVVLGESSEAREARTLLDFMSSVKARRLFTRCGLRSLHSKNAEREGM